MAPPDKPSTKEQPWDSKSAYTTLAANLEQPDKFAQIFCEAASKQKSIDNVLKDNTKSLIKSDKETRDMLKELLREVNKEDWRFFLNKIGAIGWAVILLVVGAILQGLSRKYLG